MTEEDRVVLSIAPPRAAEQQQPHGVIVKDRSGTAALDEAYEHGRSALTRLGEQGEALHRAEVVADSNQYVIDKSRRRGEHDLGEAALAEQDAYVNALSEGLEDLRGVGEALGDELADHDDRVPRLQDKMDRLWSTTRQVTRAAGRLTHASAGSTPKLLGHVALRELATKRYLRARGQDVGLSEEVDVLRATCRFALYEKRAHLLGLRSPVSGKYLAITFSAPSARRARRLGRAHSPDEPGPRARHHA
ncbi:zinc finger protein [Aureococcus anophagefferens]|nr:zinc finger protein [Aureococcus anophagefferens]